MKNSWINYPHKININNSKIEQLIDENYDTIEEILGLKTQLYPHQKKIIKAMIDLENNSVFNIAINSVIHKVENNVGILSEKVGSGKTFDILGLIMLQPMPKTLGYDIDHIMCKNKKNNVGFLIKKYFTYIYKPTLIFAGTSVIQQWLNTINEFTNLKVFSVCGIKDFEKLINMITDKSIEDYHIVLIKNGTIVRPVLPPNIELLNMNKVLSPYMYSLLANIKCICWARVIIDDFDTIHMKENSLTINALFTWYVSSTDKKMRLVPNSYYQHSEHNNLSNLLLYGNYPISNIYKNKILLYNCNIRNHPNFIEQTTELSSPNFYVYTFSNPNKKLVNIINNINSNIMEMINADAIETAAETLGIKGNNIIDIFEKILGDQYNMLLFLSKILKFIETQKQNLDKRLPWDGEETYGIRRLEKFEEITYQYPNIDKFLDEQHIKYNEEKNKVMLILNRIKDNISEDECPICSMDLKDDCDGKIVIFKCCSVVMCETCCFNTVFHKNYSSSCANCRSNINLTYLVYISKEINIDEVSKSIENGIETDDKPIIKPIQNNKYEAILDIIRNEALSNCIKVNINIPQLMVGTKILPETKLRKILIFANYEEVLKNIQSILKREHINYDILGGTYKQIHNIVDRFNKSEQHNILLICAEKYCAGLNLQIASDIIFAHSIIDPNIEAQIAGRLMRIGRTTTANFHYLLYENEYQYKIYTNRIII
jgi:hypothetical protein